jgi:carboxylesterase
MGKEILDGAAPFDLPGNDTGILVCHGFTSSPHSVRALGHGLNEAGYTVLGPLLPGHGTSPEDMATTGARDWVAEVEAALTQLKTRCSRVFMAGLSMGGTLTLYMAGQHPESFAGIIAINAVVRLENAALASLTYAPGIPAMVPRTGSDIKKSGVVEHAYPAVPVACFAELHALAAVTYALLPRVVAPTLILTSREDHVVPPANGTIIAGAIGANIIEQVALEESYHVATLDNDLPKIIRETRRFIGRLSPA